MVYGDLDGDTGVSVTDALIILKNVAGTYSLSEEQIQAGNVDVSSDGITVKDALLILKKVADSNVKFPVEIQG